MFCYIGLDFLQLLLYAVVGVWPDGNPQGWLGVVCKFVEKHAGSFVDVPGRSAVLESADDVSHQLRICIGGVDREFR